MNSALNPGMRLGYGAGELNPEPKNANSMGA